MKTIPGFAILLICSLPLEAQDLFDEALTGTAETEQTAAITFSGYARGSVYGGSENYDYSSVFAEFAFQGKLAWKNAFLFSDLRFRSGWQFSEAYDRVQIKEAYAGYSN